MNDKAVPIESAAAGYKKEEIGLVRGDLRAPDAKESWHNIANDVKLLTEGFLFLLAL